MGKTERIRPGNPSHFYGAGTHRGHPRPLLHDLLRAFPQELLRTQAERASALRSHCVLSRGAFRDGGTEPVERLCCANGHDTYYNRYLP